MLTTTPLEYLQDTTPMTELITPSLGATSIPRHRSPSQENDHRSSPYQCLFCSWTFASDDEGFAMNLAHMTRVHSMRIPKVDQVDDPEGLIQLLAHKIRLWHECLECGVKHSSTMQVQNHMRDHRHCTLILTPDPELLAFWPEPGSRVDTSVANAIADLVSATETRLARISQSRDSSPPATDPTTLQPRPSTSPAQGFAFRETGRQLSSREAMGITGLSQQQRAALASAEKKAQRGEAMAQKAREWVYAKGANSQKYDQVDNQMKWGKQNHKLQPR